MERKHIKRLNKLAKKRKHGMSKVKVFAESQELFKVKTVNNC